MPPFHPLRHHPQRTSQFERLGRAEPGGAKLSIRLTPAQRAEVLARGGATWAREVLLRELAAGTDASGR